METSEKIQEGDGSEAVREVWMKYLITVDEKPPKSNVVEEATAWLIAQGFDSPSAVDGVSDQDVDDNSPPKELVVKAFVKRTLRNINAAQQAKRAKVAGPGGSESSGSPLAPLQYNADLGLAQLGSESALAVARSLTNGVRSIDVLSKLSSSSLAGLPFHLQVDAAVWHLLDSETTAAAACNPPRKPFAYIDLTSKDVLPMWIAPDAVGGRA